MTESSADKESFAVASAQNIGHSGRDVGSVVWCLVFAAALTSEGGEGFDMEDGDTYNIVNTSSPNTVVRLVVSDESRFALKVLLDQEEVNGEFKLQFLDTIRGKVIYPLIIKNVRLFEVASTRMDFGDGNVRLLVTYTLANGTVVVNATLIMTPFSENGDSPCSSDWDCRKYKNLCNVPPNGRCRCPRGSKFDTRHKYCTMKCTVSTDCTQYLGGQGSLTCGLDKCRCADGAYLIGKTCSFPSECSNLDGSGCSGGGFCEDYRCLCPTGTIKIDGVCTPVPCKNDSDCGLWLNMECGRVSPVSTDRACRCARNTARLRASCNPITDLGPCPYGRCTVENSECNAGTATCLCKKDYVQRIYGTNWICEKQDTESADRVCQDASVCYTGEVCEDNLCRCPRGQELKDVKCEVIKKVEVKTNLRLFLWLSAAMMCLIVVFLSFGCCLYLLAQRAENEQNAIAQMFDVSEDFDIQGTA